MPRGETQGRGQSGSRRWESWSLIQGLCTRRRELSCLGASLAHTYSLLCSLGRARLVLGTFQQHRLWPCRGWMRSRSAALHGAALAPSQGSKGWGAPSLPGTHWSQRLCAVNSACDTRSSGGEGHWTLCNQNRRDQGHVTGCFSRKAPCELKHEDAGCP